MKLDLDTIAARLSEDSRVVLAVLFGSASEGTVRPGSDVDIGVLLSPQPTPLEFYAFYKELAQQLDRVAELDLVDLSRANSILAFEAISGRRLFARNSETVAGFVSQVARQYEDDMLHASRRDAA